MLLNDDPSQLQVFLDRVSGGVGMFGVRFAPKCKMVFQDWSGSTAVRVIGGEQLDEVNRFRYFSSRISPSGGISDEVSSSKQKARSPFVNL